MPKTREQKKKTLDELSKKISKAKSVIFARFNHLSVKANENLRKELKKEGSEYYVAKKTLFNLAFKDSKIDGLDIKNFDGQTAAVFGYQDEIAPAKAIANFKKKLEGDSAIEFIGGILENKYIDAGKVKKLSLLPSRQELYSRIVGSINSPVSGFVNVLVGSLKKIVYALKAIEEKKANN